MATQSNSVRGQLVDFRRFMGIDTSSVRFLQTSRAQFSKHSQPNVVFILVLGTTGAGKSTLIQHCTGKSIVVGHGLHSCNDIHAVLPIYHTNTFEGTNDLTVRSFMYQGKHVHLIDTPGFDDTETADIDTLKTIAAYLSASYANGVRINGIVYLHRISDNRLSGTSSRNLRMFKKNDQRQRVAQHHCWHYYVASGRASKRTAARARTDE